MRKNIVFKAKELSELYALKTLYSYLLEENPSQENPFNIYFSGLMNVQNPRIKELLNDVPQIGGVKEENSIDYVVNVLSDINEGKQQQNIPTLSIDVSILKNCVIPLSSEEKKTLRDKYNINSSKPIMIIGFSDQSFNEIQIIKEFYTKAEIYLVGVQNTSNRLPEEILSKIHFITQHGILKDYYAMADIALNANNFAQSHRQLNNFIEATEGGSFFLIPPTQTTLYGYKELKSAGCIQECADIDELKNKINTFIEKYTGNEIHCRLRTEHLNESRIKYLPIIKSIINTPDETNCDKIREYFKDLDISTTTSEHTKIMHQDTFWTHTAITEDVICKEKIIKETDKNLINIENLLNNHNSSKKTFQKNYDLDEKGHAIKESEKALSDYLFKQY